MAVLARFVVHSGTDPFTPMQSKIDWVQTSLPGVKQPVVRWRRYISTVEVLVEGPDGEDVRQKFEQCVKVGAASALISGLVAGFASGGTAGLTAAMTAFLSSVDTCVEAALNRAVDITARIDNSGIWSDWE